MKTYAGRTAVIGLAMCALIAVADRSAEAGICCFDNVCNYNHLHYGESPWTTALGFCGHILAGTGTGGCADASVSGSPTINVASGDCLTVGSGVTLDLGSATINCTSTACGTAVVNTTSGSGSAAVEIDDGNITGCWTAGVAFTGGTNSTINGTRVHGETHDTTHSPAAACTTYLSSGIVTPRGEINRVVVTSMLSGIYPSAGEDINDSIVQGNYVGIDNLGSSSATQELTNVQFLENGYAVKNVTNGTYKPKMTAVSMQFTGGTCQCINSSLACINNVTDCANFGTSTAVGNTSFVGQAMYP